MTKSDSIQNLAAALAIAQGQIENATKGADNPFFRSKYADLASIRDAVRRPFADNGLSVVQPVTVDGAKVTVTTMLMHSSGEWIASDLTMIAQRQKGKDSGGGWEEINTPQAIGSTTAYARRYALAAMAAVATEDDDGEGSEGRDILISKAQQERIFAISRTAGKKPADVLAILKKHGYTRTEEIALMKYEAICREIEAK